MAAPIKPWEAIASTNMYNRNIPSVSSSSFQGTPYLQDQNHSAGYSGIGTNASPRVPPPLPPRPSVAPSGMSQYYSPYTSPYGNSFTSMFSPYGGYGNYGYGGYGYNRYGGYPGNDAYNGDNSFVQVAEENTRQAFQSVESVVHAISSIGMMLESTYHAVYSSFRAVIGVADHFNRIKLHLTQMLSLVALIRSLKIIYHKLLTLLGLTDNTVLNQMAWDASAASTSTELPLNESDLKQTRHWSALVFIALFFGIPWLLWKIFSSFSQIKTEVSKEWARGRTEHFIAIADYDFNSDNNREISFRVGQEIRLAPKELQPRVRGWLLGSTDGTKTGLVPANYIRIVGKRSGTQDPDNFNSGSEKELSGKLPQENMDAL